MENKEVMIKLHASIGDYDGQNDSVEITTQGHISRNGDVWVMEYDESDLTGVEGSKTTLSILPDRIIMDRGVGGARMEFEEGRRFTSEYPTMYGNFKLELLTKKINVALGEDGKGDVFIAYDMSLKGLSESVNELSIKVF